MLILAYCLGLGLLFIVLAYGSVTATGSLARLRRHTRHIQIVGGLALIAVGIALVTGQWAIFIDWLRAEFVTNTVLPI